MAFWPWLAFWVQVLSGGITLLDFLPPAGVGSPADKGEAFGPVTMPLGDATNPDWPSHSDFDHDMYVESILVEILELQFRIGPVLHSPPVM